MAEISGLLRIWEVNRWTNVWGENIGRGRQVWESTDVSLVRRGRERRKRGTRYSS